jgi:homoserine kinase type II
MGVYSDINLEEINNILSHYELGHAVSYTATIEGISNSNYQVELNTGNKILLKVSNDKTVEQLSNEQAILMALADYNYEYSLKPFKTIFGKPIYQHKHFYGVVFPFIKGLPPVITVDSIFQIGAALGKLHSLELRKEDIDRIRPHDIVGHGAQSIIDYASSKNPAEDFVVEFEKIFPDKLENIPYDVFPVGIIHGDLYFDNSLFNDNKLVTLIDFEQSGRGRYILDLGIAISGSCLDDDKSNISEELMTSFLKGYETNRKLLVIEKEYITTAILVGFFSIALWRIERFYDGKLDDSKRYNYRELLKRAINFNNSLK